MVRTNEMGLGLRMNAGPNTIAEVHPMGGVAANQSDLRVGDRIVAIRPVHGGSSVDCGAAPLAELLQCEALAPGAEQGWMFTICRGPNAPSRAVAGPRQAVTAGNL